MQKINLAWLLAGTLATTQCGRGPDPVGESRAAPATSETANALAAAANEAEAGGSCGACAGGDAAAEEAKAEAPAAERVSIEGLPVFGNPRAAVTIVVFTDYECPYCQKADRTLQTLRSEFGPDVRVALAMRPLPMHDHARAASLALLAAAAQGRAEAMHARLFADPSALDGPGLLASARAVGLDLAAFETARASAATAEQLARADRLAASLDVRGTPTFFVNGHPLVGARPIEDFRALVVAERARAVELVAHGVAPEAVYPTLMAAAPVHVVSAPVEEDDVVKVAVDGAPSRGPNDAPVTIAFFSDFECPYCEKAEATLRAVEAAYPGKVRVAFRHRPLPMHAHARLAAKASIAAEAQGQFWPYHDLLVGHRDALERPALEGYAASLGLDRARFASDLDDPRLDARVSQDDAQATQLKVLGTPTAFVNGRRITGAQPLSVYRAAVERALAGK